MEKWAEKGRGSGRGGNGGLDVGGKDGEVGRCEARGKEDELSVWSGLKTQTPCYHLSTYLMVGGSFTFTSSSILTSEAWFSSVTSAS